MNKKVFCDSAKDFCLVGVQGFEPWTSCTPCKRATSLRHTPLYASEESIEDSVCPRKAEYRAECP